MCLILKFSIYFLLQIESLVKNIGEVAFGVNMSVLVRKDVRLERAEKISKVIVRMPPTSQREVDFSVRWALNCPLSGTFPAITGNLNQFGGVGRGIVDGI